MINNIKVKLIDQSAKILNFDNSDDELFIIKKLAYAARVCIDTQNLNTYNFDTDVDLLKRIINKQHMSVFEHASLTCEFTTSRAIANQLVRHRIAAYSQQSTRYVKPKRESIAIDAPHIVYVITPYSYFNWDDECKASFVASVTQSVYTYKLLNNSGIKAEDARDVLPLCLATKLVATWNLRELFHILFNPVCGRFSNEYAQPQMRELMSYLYNDMLSKYPTITSLAELYKDVVNKC